MAISRWSACSPARPHRSWPLDRLYAIMTGLMCRVWPPFPRSKTFALSSPFSSLSFLLPSAPSAPSAVNSSSSRSDVDDRRRVVRERDGVLGEGCFEVRADEDRGGGGRGAVIVAAVEGFGQGVEHAAVVGLLLVADRLEHVPAPEG